MNVKLYYIFCGITALLVSGCGSEQRDAAADETSIDKPQAEAQVPDRKGTSSSTKPMHRTVMVGDTLEQVDDKLGEPRIEFPDGKRMIRWYEGFEVVISNNVVIAAHPIPTD